MQYIYRPPRDLQFCEQNFCDLEVNHEIHENIVPQTFGVIRYLAKVMMVHGGMVDLALSERSTGDLIFDVFCLITTPFHQVPSCLGRVLFVNGGGDSNLFSCINAL